MLTAKLFLLHSQDDSDGDTEEMVLTLTCSNYAAQHLAQAHLSS